MKKFLVILLAVALALSVGLIGCGGTPSEQEEEEEEAIQLLYGDQNPEGGWAVEEAAKPWLAAIEQVTAGAVEIEPYWAQTLAAGPDLWEAVEAGTADFAWCFHGYWAGMTPLADAVSLPFMPFESAEQAAAIFWTIYEEYPNLAGDFDEDNKILLTWCSSPYILITTTAEPVKTLEDMSGLKIRATGGPPTTQTQLLGAIPQTVGMPGTYEALQKGEIDGMWVPWEALYSFKQYEYAKSWTILPAHAVYFTQAMNWDTWNSLPSEVQDQFMTVGGEDGSRFWGRNMFDTSQAACRDVILADAELAAEIQEYVLPQEELDRWVDMAGQPIWDEWVTEMEADGFDEAQEVLDRVLELIDEVPATKTLPSPLG